MTTEATQRSGCDCPPVWFGTVPPPCGEHNPQPPLLTVSKTGDIAGMGLREDDPTEPHEPTED